LSAAALFGLSTPAGKALLASIHPAVLAGLFYCGAGVGMAILRRILQWRASPATEVALVRIGENSFLRPVSVKVGIFCSS
jgi:hypothetical protein